jgi:predicted O-linked N-acetylglucosamine transferase (SPINDLY family)
VAALLFTTLAVFVVFLFSGLMYVMAAAVNNNLALEHFQRGSAHFAQGQIDLALAHLQEAVRLAPDFVEAHNNLATVYLRQRQGAKAAAHYRRTLELRPNNADAHSGLGAVFAEQGIWDEAVPHFQDAVRLRPDSAEAHCNLANALKSVGHLDKAEAHSREALRLRPIFPQARDILGSALSGQGRVEEAVDHFRQVVLLGPQFASAHNNLGGALHRLGRLDEAEHCYRRALALQPDFAVAHCNLGNVLQEQSHLDEALASYRNALGLNPSLASAYFSLSTLLWAQDKREQAAQCAREAVRLQPGNFEYHVHLGAILQEQGLVEETITAYKQALSLGSTARLRIALASVLPVIYQSVEDLRYWRARLLAEVTKLQEQQLRHGIASETATSLFYLAYQDGNNRQLYRDFARLHSAPAVPTSRQSIQFDSSGRRIKVGFVSSFFRKHTIGHWYRGLIAQLSRQDFEVVVLSVGQYQDEMAEFFKKHADYFVEVPRFLPAARQRIVDEKLDVLIYPDIGMHPTTNTLAFSRLAPVQCATLGHPVTTGIETIDYFISSEALEPEGAKEHYTETLIRLKALPTYYYRPEPPAKPKDRAQFGIGAEDHVYFCPQSLFKFHPEFDELLGGILRSDPRGTLLLSKGSAPRWEQQLTQRFEKTLPDVVNRIRFVPWLNYADYLSLLTVADVQLDTLHFGGGSTSYDGLAMGTPIVTWPTQYLRGRITFALYQQMQMLDCVAHSAQEYIDMAVRLGTNSGFRDSIRAKILAANGVLFENSQGVRELEQFLKRVYNEK